MFHKSSNFWDKIILFILLGSLIFFICYSYFISISLFPVLAFLGVILIIILLKYQKKDNYDKEK